MTGRSEPERLACSIGFRLVERERGMHLELSDEMVAVLRDLITWHLGDLSVQIADTDSPAFRRELMRRRDLLLHVNDALSAPNPPAGPS